MNKVNHSQRYLAKDTTTHLVAAGLMRKYIPLLHCGLSNSETGILVYHEIIYPN